MRADRCWSAGYGSHHHLDPFSARFRRRACGVSIATRSRSFSGTSLVIYSLDAPTAVAVALGARLDSIAIDDRSLCRPIHAPSASLSMFLASPATAVRASRNRGLTKIPWKSPAIFSAASITSFVSTGPSPRTIRASPWRFSAARVRPFAPTRLFGRVRLPEPDQRTAHRPGPLFERSEWCRLLRSGGSVERPQHRQSGDNEFRPLRRIARSGSSIVKTRSSGFSHRGSILQCSERRIRSPRTIRQLEIHLEQIPGSGQAASPSSPVALIAVSHWLLLPDSPWLTHHFPIPPRPQPCGGAFARIDRPHNSIETCLLRNSRGSIAVPSSLTNLRI